jgi:CHAT domain-containing protein
LTALSYLKQKPRPPKRAKNLLAFGAPLYHQAAVTAETREGTPAGLWRESCIDKGLTLSPLPFSESEVIKVARLFSADMKDVLLGKQANETILKKLPLKEYQIIHFACHGILDDTLPFRSALALSYDESQEEDGFLQVREIYNLDLDADLVVLSACQTGNGTLEKGEGLVGLTRSFFHAGAQSILSSIWSINDRSTASFMEDFYSSLSRGQDKSGALRVAKLNMLRSPHAHPFNWAGFILNGDPAPILIEGNKVTRSN